MRLAAMGRTANRRPRMMRLPVDVATERRSRRRITVLAAPATAGFAAAAHLMISGGAGTARRLVLDEGTGTYGEADFSGDGSLTLAAVAFYVVAWAIGAVMTHAADLTVTGHGARLGIAATVRNLGLALGCAASVTRWPAPAGVGRQADLPGSPGAAWATEQWLVYRLPLILPAAFLALAIWHGARLTRSLRRQDAEYAAMRRVLAQGRTVRGEIERVTFRNTWYGANPEFHIMVAFAGLTGRRVIAVRIVTTPADAPVRGGTVNVSYDPYDPDNDLAVLVQPDPHSRLKADPGQYEPPAE